MSINAIRDDIEIIKGPTVHGRQSYVLYDPVNDKYIQLSYENMMILSYGNFSEEQIIAKLKQQKIDITKEDIEDLNSFISKSGLSIGFTPEDSALKAAKSKSQGWLKWLIHHYLFIRFKVFNPDKMLSFVYRNTSFLFTPVTYVFLILLALIDSISVWSQWSDYSANFKDFLTPSGIFMGMCAVGLSKIAHEFGHGIASKHYKLRIPSCGVAFLVMAPVLWTDTTEAWRLKDNYKRVLIDCAGMISEITLAIFATLLWCLWDDGSFRHFLFILSSTTWVIAVMVNVSPLMRFDGYRILSDTLGVPNLMDRAFKYSKWRLRKNLLGLNLEEPDDFSPRQKIAVLIYSPSTWIYRFGLFTGIALMVYHATFHALGIILMGIEIGTFVIAPIIKEFYTWFFLLKEHGMTKQAYITITLIISFVVACFIPFASHETLHGIAVPQKSYDVYLPSGRLDVLASNGNFLKKGELVGDVYSSDISSKLRIAVDHLKTNEMKLASVENEKIPEQDQISDLIKEIEKSKSEINDNQMKIKNLKVYAPFDGLIIDRQSGLQEGQYVNEKEKLESLVSKEKKIISYVPESMIAKIKEGDKACFYKGYGLGSCHKIHISHIDYASTKDIKEAEMSSVYHGFVRSHKSDKNNIVPDNAVYKVSFLGENINLEYKDKVNIRLEIHRTSIFKNALTKSVSLILKESGL